MMKDKLSYILFFVTFYSLGQTAFVLKGKISAQPISYATIWKSNKIYTTSDSLGVFRIMKNDFGSNFKITCVGYKALSSEIAGDEHILFLEEEVKQLNELTIVVPKRNKTFKLGKSKNGDIGVVCTNNENQTVLIGKYFTTANQKNLFLNILKFRTFSSKENRIVEMFIYAVDESGAPDKIINTEPIICKIDKGHHVNEINLNKQNIEMSSEGIFVVIQYLFLEENRQYGRFNKEWFFYEPSIDASKTEIYTDSWHFTDGLWEKSNNYSLNFQLTLTD